jgi:hypothetical protein
VSGTKTHKSLCDGPRSQAQRLGRRARRILALLACLILLQTQSTMAWTYPEHREITTQAIEELKPEQLASLEKLWSEARAGHETRLCSQLSQPDQGRKPTCIDFAAWPAIAGDHSCSAEDMLHNVLDTNWILGVARVGAQLETKLAAAERPDQFANAMRTSSLSFVKSDPAYVTRAASNNAHFLLALPNVSIKPADYARLVFGGTVEPNAVATYGWYHLQALAKAASMAHDNPTGRTREQQALAILADEAFALHFLEDGFAAGHLVGTWGNKAVRLGTHDYYNQHGVAVDTWDGIRFVAFGDAYLNQDNEERVAKVVRDSLAQVIDAVEGKLPNTPSEASPGNVVGSLNTCTEAYLSPLLETEADIHLLLPIIQQTPVPGIGPGKGELPRFGSELGPFIGLTTAVRFADLGGGFGSNQTSSMVAGGIEVGVRAGAGLEGVLNQSSDGLLFAEIGLREDSATSGANGLPARGALTARFRAPFWLIPGDVLVAAPVLAWTNPAALKKMAARAANGGLIPWQQGIATPIGRFQFVLGREVGLSFYSSHTIALPATGATTANQTLVSLRSIAVEFPILEYRLFRTFSQDQSSGLLIQPYAGFATPSSTAVVSPPGTPLPPLRTIGVAGVRVVFDWRHY